MTTLKYILRLMFTALLLSLESYAQQPTNVPVDVNSGDQSETAITADINNSNHLMGTWNDFSNGTFSRPGFAFSTDGGNSWSTGVITPNVGYGFDPSCVIDKSGNEYYTYGATSTPGVLGAIDISVSTDNGQHWPNTYQVSPASSQQDKPYMAIDNTGGTYDGRLYVHGLISRREVQ